MLSCRLTSLSWTFMLRPKVFITILSFTEGLETSQELFAVFLQRLGGLVAEELDCVVLFVDPSGHTLGGHLALSAC